MPSNTQVVNPGPAYVSQDGDGLRVRNGAGLKYGILGQLHALQPINVLVGNTLSDGYTWVKVQTDTLMGWVDSEFLRPGEVPLPIGFDLSSNNLVDMTTLKADFFIHKASEGTYHTDSRYHQRQMAALQINKPFAAYHFGTGGNVSKQVSVFLQAANVDGKTPLVLDLEENPDKSPDSEGPMTLSQAVAFIETIRATCGVSPIIYSRANYLNSLLDNPQTAVYRAALLSCPLWISSSHTPPVLPNGWKTWALNQYTQTNGLDTNRFNGTSDQLKSFWSTMSAKLVSIPIPATSNNDSSWINHVGTHLMGILSQDEIKQVAKYGVVKGMSYGERRQDDALIYLHSVNPSATYIHRDWSVHNTWGTPEALIANNGGDIVKAVRVWIAANLEDNLKKLPFAYHESFNEVGMSDLYLKFEAERCYQLHALGYKACVLNIAGATADTSDWQRAKDCGLLDAVSKTGALIGVHAYSQTVLSCSTGGSYWDEHGDWQGEVFPTSVPKDKNTGNWLAWLALRPLRYVYDVIKLGYPNIRFVITESGCDDCAQGKNNGVYYPREGKQNGWRQCPPTWKRLGWVNSIVSPEAFYLKQIKWMIQMVMSIYPHNIVGYLFYTHGQSEDPKWQPFDTRGVL